jgi:FixJ family two-component response regulator
MSAPIPYIAVVDDDAPVRRALTRLLNASAYRSLAYSSASEFLDSLASAFPECLIVDFQMPDMNGFELHDELVRAGVRIPTIVVTAHQNGNCREWCRAAGATLLRKPLDHGDLISAINRALGRS